MTSSASEPFTRKKKSIHSDQIAYCKIHPGLGVARVGDSADEYFVGPESPNHMPHPVGGFKDKHGRIKRQAARFRIFAYNEAGEAIDELTADDADIHWSVQLANKKASFRTFLGRYWDIQYADLKKYADEHTNGEGPLRNQQVVDPAQRAQLLEIHSEARSISGKNEHGAKYEMSGTFGPLKYTVVTAGDNNEALQGSRNGFMNVPFNDPTNQQVSEQVAEAAKKYHWQAGVLREPVADSGQAQVYLGEVRTDHHGRLLVLGGRGVSQSLIHDNAIGFLNNDDYFGSNDYWYDDTSDGVVTAEVTLKSGKRVEVREKSWVIVAPPKFAPHLQTLTTLSDVSDQVAQQKGELPPHTEVSFLHDVYPILRRLNEYQWVNQFALQQHGSGMVFDPLSQGDGTCNIFPQLHTPVAKDGGTDANEKMRLHVFKFLRKPVAVLQAEHPELSFKELIESQWADENSGMTKMPQMWGDGGDGLDPSGQPAFSTTDETNPGGGIPGGTYITWATLTQRQYEALRLWAEGKFIDDWPPQASPLHPPGTPVTASLPVKAQPASLDRASMDPCVGAPFYPGIEITFICEDPELWAEPGRLQWRTLEPGDITRYMALPWQADFSECNHRWWPAARPDDVVPQEQYEAVIKFYDETVDGPLQANLAARVEWARGIPQVSPLLDQNMVMHWSEFGFVLPQVTRGQTVYVEMERDKYALTSLRDAFYYLMNIASYSDFLPHARKMVDGFLLTATKNAIDPNAATLMQSTGWNYFPYTPDAFDARLQDIYNQYVLANQSTTYLTQSTYDQQKFSQIQIAPFNQLDGAWIRGAAPPGTVDEARNLLFQIYMDELGDAIAAHNHANVYTDLIRSLNVYLPEIQSRDYANSTLFLDSAFVQPVFLLAISEFTEEFLPEILGMTLYLEWSSVGLTGTVHALESFGIDPAYYRLHVGIDNASAGHGALAKKACELFLDNIRAQGGDRAMQEAFERIWTGYVAFGTLGSLGQDIQTFFQGQDDLLNAMETMIESKAQYARQNHGIKKLGPNFMNDWFDDPIGLLQELVASGFIIPGFPEQSPIFELMAFTGPMFHVFTPAEQVLWKNYITSLGAPQPIPKVDLEKAMLYLVDKLRQRQSGTPGHQARLTGVDPRDNSTVTMPIDWWFKEQFTTNQTDNDYVFLVALCNPVNGWIVPGVAAQSPMITQLLAGNNDMAQAFRDYVPELVKAPGQTGDGPYTFKQILSLWVDDGCRIRGVAEASFTAKKKADAKGRIPGRAKGKPVALAPSAVKRPLRVYGMGVPH